ncbi:glycosyl transferase GT2 family [Eubacterium limosum]|nr:glycosyl transferase GT2 family [Eubacterium limosum]
MKKIAGIVTLYEPPSNILSNIDTYYKAIDILIVLDNSPIKSSEILKTINNKYNCVYYSFGKNLGLAYALDYGCKIADNLNCDYVLMMDQDSYFEDNSADKLVDFAKNNQMIYGMICPNVKNLYYSKGEFLKGNSIYNLCKDSEVKWAITSGSLVSLWHYFESGGIDKFLFIDHIDRELGIKFYIKKFKIYILNEAILYQRPGNSKEVKVFGKLFHPSCHKPQRVYYIFRNHFYLKKKYKKLYTKFFSPALYKIILSIIFFEDNKQKKLYLMFLGIRDSKTNLE